MNATRIPACLLLSVVAIGGGWSTPAFGQQVDSTNTGVPVLSHPAIPDDPALVLQPDLVLGADGDVVFGDVRGIDMTADGRILVLDHQASELLQFDLTGRALGALFTRGQGPHEIGAASGVQVDGEGAVWVNDHGNRRLTRLLPDGEVETTPRFIGGFNFRWAGGVTNDGRVWERWGHADRTVALPGPGLYVNSVGTYFLGLDPHTGAIDSVYLGRSPVRQINLRSGVMPVPFRPERLQTISRSGTIWTAISSRYRLAQISPTGDTTLVVDVDTEPEPVSRVDRAQAIAQVEEFMERAGRASVDWDEAMPRTKPVVTDLIADDDGGVWVQRERDGATLFEWFGADGQLRGHFRAAYTPHPYRSPVIRHGWLLAVQVDEWDVQTVVCIRIPE